MGQKKKRKMVGRYSGMLHACTKNLNIRGGQVIYHFALVEALRISKGKKYISATIAELDFVDFSWTRDDFYLSRKKREL